MSDDLIKRDSVIKILHIIDEKLSAEQCNDKAKQCMYECAREMLSILQKAVNAIPCANEESVRFSDAAKALEKAISIEIVACAECKYNSICNHGVQHTTRDMSSVTIGYKSVDFCSYGERRADDE